MKRKVQVRQRKFGGKNLPFRILEALSSPSLSLLWHDQRRRTCIHTQLPSDHHLDSASLYEPKSSFITRPYMHANKLPLSVPQASISTPLYLAHLFAITLVVVKSMLAMMDSLGMSTIEGRLVTTVCQALPLPGYRMAPEPNGCCALCVCVCVCVRQSVY